MAPAICAAALSVVALGACGGQARPSSTTPPRIAGPSDQRPTDHASNFVPAPSDTLTVSNGGWSNTPTSFSYQWERCNRSGDGCVAVSGATSSSYTIRATDLGGTLRVLVTARNGHGSASASSVPTPVVARGSVTPDYFIAQTATGSANGSSCANAKPYTWFNTAANWGPDKSIAPGIIVGLCGTITGAPGDNAVLTAQGSGNQGHQITVYWEPGASVQAPACYSAGPNTGPGCFNTNGQSYLTLDGGQNGSILSTANGFREANGNQFSKGIWAVGSSNLIVENLNISDMWRINGSVAGIPSSSCNADTGQDISGIQIGAGSNITIANDTFEWDRTAVTWYPVRGTDSNVSVHGTTMRNDGTGMTWVANTNGGGNIGPVLFYDNTLSGFSAWETGTSACVHDDGIHGWDSAGDTPPHYNGVYIYDNRFSGLGAAFPGDATGYIFLESGTVGSATIFADKTSPVYIFNNVLSGVSANALIVAGSGKPYIYNNTVVGTSKSSGSCIQPYTDGGSSGAATVENNAVSRCATLADMYSASGTVAVDPTWDYNVYDDGSAGGAWLWAHDYNPFTSAGFVTGWQSSRQANGDTHSCATFGAGAGACRGKQNSILLDAAGQPRSDSPVIGAGTNLARLCTGYVSPLCSSIDGTARPRAGAWDVGAY